MCSHRTAIITALRKCMIKLRIGENNTTTGKVIDFLFYILTDVNVAITLFQFFITVGLQASKYSAEVRSAFCQHHIDLVTGDLFGILVGAEFVHYLFIDIQVFPRGSDCSRALPKTLRGSQTAQGFGGTLTLQLFLNIEGQQSNSFAIWLMSRPSARLPIFALAAPITLPISFIPVAPVSSIIFLRMARTSSSLIGSGR